MTKLLKSQNSFSTSPRPIQLTKPSVAVPLDDFSTATNGAKAEIDTI
jgi:hypothetical protein